jgi:hypothetical protein
MLAEEAGSPAAFDPFVVRTLCHWRIEKKNKQTNKQKKKQRAV